MSETMSLVDVARRVLAAQSDGEPVAVVMVISGPGAAAVGRRLVVTADSVDGGLGARERDERAVSLARGALASGERGLHEIEMKDGAWQLYVEPQLAVPDLLIIGAGHIARPLCHLGALLGFRVTVADDRPEFATREYFPDAAGVERIDFAEPFAKLNVTKDSYVVLVTRGHKYDYDSILELLRMDVQPAYLGMIGSRRRVRAAFEALVGDGVDAKRLEGVHAPIGLDIAAETPEEIALAIAAELVAVRRGGSGGRLSLAERVIDKVKGKDHG